MPFAPKLRRRLSVSPLALLLAVAALSGCARDSGVPTSPRAGLDARAPVALSATSLSQAIAAENRYSDMLLGYPGVIGVGVGAATATTPTTTAQAAIEVYCLGAVPAGLPKSLDGVAVRAEVVGQIAPFALNDRLRPAPLGASLGNNNECLPGTLGCMVKKNGTRYVLSANHVLARQNQGAIGEDIMQPSRPDASAACDPEPATNRVARLSEFQTVVYDGKTLNAMDAALAEVTGDVGASTLPEHYGTPGATPAAAAVGMPIQKVGRTTGFTLGTVKAVNVKVKITFPSGTALFTGQIMTSKMFGDFGDSGALVVTRDGSRSPVGMVIGGSNVGGAIVTPIGPILSRFGVTVSQN